MSRESIDHSVYPDLDRPPDAHGSAEERADYVHRICTAWDHGVHPDPETFAMLSRWKGVFDRFPVATSPAYHAFRAWFRWESLPWPPGLPGPTPRYVHLDRQEGREDDPCDAMI